MPVWGQVILGAAAVVTALGILWSKVLKPLLKFANQAEEMIPLLRNVTETFKSDPTALRVLREMSAQFRTDSGSSLRDVVNRLEVTSEQNKTAAEVLRVNVEAAKQLAERDSRALVRVETLLDKLVEESDTKKPHA